MTKYLAIGAGVLAAIAGVLGWLLLEAHEDLGAATLAAKVNAATIKTLQANEARNVEIDKQLEEAIKRTAATTREVMRAIASTNDTGACAGSPAIRALDGLRRPAGPLDSGQAPAAAPSQPVRTPGR